MLAHLKADKRDSNLKKGWSLRWISTSLTSAAIKSSDIGRFSSWFSIISQNFCFPGSTFCSQLLKKCSNERICSKEWSIEKDLNEPGPSRSSRQRPKCPVPGCPITRSIQEALNVHMDNSHDCNQSINRLILIIDNME